MVLPRSMRIKGHRCFDHLHRAGIRYQSPSMLLRVVKARNSLLKGHNQNFIEQNCRFAVAISSKVSKKAVIRNRLRRLLHNHLRLRFLGETHSCNIWALLSLKPTSLNKEPLKLLEECDQLLRNAGMLL